MRADCLAVHELMEQVTGEPAAMWSKGIVGFGSFRYRGRTSEGEWFPVNASAFDPQHCSHTSQSCTAARMDSTPFFGPNS